MNSKDYVVRELERKAAAATSLAEAQVLADQADRLRDKYSSSLAPVPILRN
jgi:hypothetical protein